MAKQRCRISVYNRGDGTYFGRLEASRSIPPFNTKAITIHYGGPVRNTRAKAAEDVNRLARFLELVGRAR